MKKVYIVALLSLMGQSSWAQIRDFQTTRLNSTAGTGVASILTTEAAILNPASAAFFQDSSASYQRNSVALKDKDKLRDARSDKFPKSNLSHGYFVADHGGPIKGGVSYITQDENNFERERMSIHASAPMGANSAMGLSYRYTRDTMPRRYAHRHDIFHQVALGVLQVIDEKTTLGLVLVDPTRTNPGDERLLAGFQYQLADKLIFMGDIGYQYTKAYDKAYSWSGAGQINIFADFFLRGGLFYDNIRGFKGTGWGVSWIGPRLGVEFAQKYSDQFKRYSYIYKGEGLTDTTVSAIIKF